MSENSGPVRVALRALRRAVAGEDYPPPRPERRWPRLWAVVRPLGLLVLIIVYAATAQFFVSGRVPDLVAWLFALLAVAPVPLLFRRPLWAWRLSLIGLLISGSTSANPPWSPTNILVALLALALVATLAEPAVAVWIGVLSLVPAVVYLRQDGLLVTGVLVAMILLAGDQIRRFRHTRRALAAQTEVSELEQARRTVLEERARIARELHDVVAHHMSLIAVRAETAPYRLGGLPESAQEEFAAMAGAAREALAEMRRLLGVLRSESAVPELAPQPDLAAIDDLVAAARRAGMSVHYLPPEPDGLERPPGAVALAGFRIVQEALANCTRHAPGAAVTVQVWPGSRELLVRVHNEAPPGGAGDGAALDPDDGVGHGLAGMRERATLLGGEFSAGPTSDGGFTVAATMPYGDDDTP